MRKYGHQYPVKNIYVNIPYCESKCYWCYIPIQIGNKDKANSYFQAIKEEIGNFDINQESITTSIVIERVYFGGGTANFLSSSHLAEIFNLLKHKFCFSNTPIVSIEVFPNWQNKEPFE
jgi:oxygen-independent coproporphyrinogen-3 oxidase